MKLYPKIPHLPSSRTGLADKHIGQAQAKRLLEACEPSERVIVQEKLDGSNVIVTRQSGDLLALGRDGRLCANSINPLRIAFATWLEQNAQRFTWLAESERLALEWLAVAHGTQYELPHEPLVALDFSRQMVHDWCTRIFLRALHRQIYPSLECCIQAQHCL
jgi:hypothetical protein